MLLVIPISLKPILFKYINHNSKCGCNSNKIMNRDINLLNQMKYNEYAY